MTAYKSFYRKQKPTALYIIALFFTPCSFGDLESYFMFSKIWVFAIAICTDKKKKNTQEINSNKNENLISLFGTYCHEDSYHIYNIVLLISLKWRGQLSYNTSVNW